MRNLLYAIARFLGDARAVRRGTIAKRLANRLIGRSIVSRLWIR